MRWEELEPDPAMALALGNTDEGGSRVEALDGNRELRHGWSNRFADECAQMIADALRRNSHFRRFELRPHADRTGREALTFVAAGRKKRVDVIAATLATGLQLGVSLKGLNFPGSNRNYDHNLTGRTYELQDEVGVIHEYQPAAFIVGLYMLPLHAVSDKTERAPSSFARTVAHLRARTGRTDPTLASQFRRCDAAAVGLYVPNEPGHFSPAGVVRFLDVKDDPPRRGRPQVDTTLDLDELVARWAQRHAMDEAAIEWADPEA